jgi:hypothetical protein
MRRAGAQIILGLFICNLTMLCAFALPQTQSVVRKGISVEELDRLMRAVPALPGRIYSIRFLRDARGNFPGFVALLVMNPTGGWYVYVFRSEDRGSFALDWKSAKLDDSFAVGSPDDLRTFDLGDEYGFTFEGCAPHACPEFFSVLLYAPSAHKSFTATYEDGKIGYSSGLDAPANHNYKVVLDEEIAKGKATRSIKP